ncbi:MAG: triacylglycerol lipase [Benniella sp.]|nr:MAG: triacylglycerol lipase [Benniella sp.]
MIFSKTLSVAALALAAIASVFVDASPIPASQVEAYVPVAERVYTAEQLEHHAALRKRGLPGVNDWNCKPSQAHPKPLILIHGLIANEWDNWLYMAPRFKAKGYCVYALTYGSLPGIPLLAGLDSMETGAAQLSTFVDKVLASTNTTKVDFVGHSQGSLMPRYYLKFLGGAAKVDKFGAFGTIAYGTDLLGLIPLATSLGLYDPIKKILDPVCKSCFQFLIGSDFLNKLNAGGDTVPGVQYKFIVSKYDEIVTPYTNGKLKDVNPKATNVVLQDLCSVDLSEHAAQMLDPIVFHSLNAFLDSAAPQNVNCLSAFLK